MSIYSVNRSQALGVRHYELDALRGLAAISIVLFHFTINHNSKLLGWQFSYGVTAVDIFFMISGFVILQSLSNIRSWQDFAVKRFARLYPAFWYCMLVTAFFAVVAEPRTVDFSRILANATMAPIYFGEENLDGSYWTLLVELIFYLWILAVFVTHRIRQIDLIGAFCLAAIILFHELRGYYPDFYQFIMRKIQLMNHFPLFFSGILFYRISKNGFTARSGIFILFSLFASFYLHDKGGTSQYHISFEGHCAAITLFHIVFVLFVTGNLRFLAVKPLLFLGQISYCLYLIHQYVGLQIITKLNADWGLNIVLAISVTIGICICVAYLITRYIEIPCYQLVRDWYSGAGRKIYSQQDKDLVIH